MRGVKKPMAKRKKKPVCIKCEAPCCRNLAMPTTRPRTRYEIDLMKWYLHFDVMKVFIRHRQWFLLVDGCNCMYLDDDSMCMKYDERMDVFHDHNPPECERFGEFWDVLMTKPEELDEYLKPKRKRKKL